MLIRISLILAIVAALAAGALSFTQVRGKITTLMQQRDDYHTQLTDTQGKLAKTQKDLATTQKNLADTQQQLTDSQAAQKKAESVAAAQQKRADDLSDKLTKAAADRDKAQAELAAYTASGLTAKEVADLSRSLKSAQNAIEAMTEEKLLLTRTIERLHTELDKYIGTNRVVTMRSDLRGKILVVDPKWDFVVLNVGDEQGVKDEGELLVSRDGKLVAKVIVRSIQKDRCIANIVPGWKLGEVIEGDEVSPAHPAS
jgi:cell shape-determining protein MreC